MQTLNLNGNLSFSRASDLTIEAWGEETEVARGDTGIGLVLLTLEERTAITTVRTVFDVSTR